MYWFSKWTCTLWVKEVSKWMFSFGSEFCVMKFYCDRWFCCGECLEGLRCRLLVKIVTKCLLILALLDPTSRWKHRSSQTMNSWGFCHWSMRTVYCYTNENEDDWLKKQLSSGDERKMSNAYVTKCLMPMWQNVYLIRFLEHMNRRWVLGVKSPFLFENILLVD